MAECKIPALVMSHTHNIELDSISDIPLTLPVLPGGQTQ